MRTDVLYVETNPVFGELTRKTVERMGLRLVVVSDLRLVLQTALRLHPALILLNGDLPSGEGMRICNELRSHHETEELPILVLTSEEQQTASLYWAALGADAVLSEPFTGFELQRTIERLMSSDLENSE